MWAITKAEAYKVFSAIDLRSQGKVYLEEWMESTHKSFPGEFTSNADVKIQFPSFSDFSKRSSKNFDELPWMFPSLAGIFLLFDFFLYFMSIRIKEKIFFSKSVKLGQTFTMAHLLFHLLFRNQSFHLRF